MESLNPRQVRRLALARAGLLKPALTGLPTRAAGKGPRARSRCHSIVERFGYLQLDSVSVSGARTHAIVLASRLENLDASLGEELLSPGEPLFEYWGHEACWMPMALVPLCFAFRRREFQVHPWRGDLLGEHPRMAVEIMRRVEQEGAFPIRGSGGQRRPGLVGFQAFEARRRGFVVRRGTRHREPAPLPQKIRSARARHPARRLPRQRRRVTRKPSTCCCSKALEGHGWATTGTLSATWRLVNCRRSSGGIVTAPRGKRPNRAVQAAGKPNGNCPAGCARKISDLAAGSRQLPDRAGTGACLLSPFDPVLWDRERVRLLFDFDQVLEIYKPAAVHAVTVTIASRCSQEIG